MSEVTITGLNRTVHPKANKAGHTILAHFSFEARGFAFRNWVFVCHREGELQAWPPMIEENKATRRGIVLRDLDLRDELNERVIAAYRALGGFIAEDAAA